MLRKKQRTTYRRGQSRPSKAYVARIARSVVRRNEETKCFTQTLLNGTSSTNSWEFKSALAGLTQGTSTTTRVGAQLLLWQLSTLLRLLLLWLPVGGEGSMCRMVFYHNKAAAGAVPDVAQIFDTNNFYSGRNVNYATKFSLLDDITHQMVITSYNSSSGVAFSRSRAVQKIIRVTPRTVVQFGGNAGTISDLPLDDFGVAHCSDDVTCCLVTVVAKVWFKDA